MTDLHKRVGWAMRVRYFQPEALKFWVFCFCLRREKKTTTSFSVLGIKLRAPLSAGEMAQTLKARLTTKNQLRAAHMLGRNSAGGL